MSTILKYIQFNEGIESAIDYTQYKNNKKQLKLFFIDQIQPLNNEKFLLAYLGFRQEKCKQEVLKNGICFYSHLEDLFQEELVLRNISETCVISKNNNTQDGFSAVEKRLIKRFKIIKKLTNQKLIERFIILTNRIIERNHEIFFGLDQDPDFSQALPNKSWKELCFEKKFLVQELKNRNLQIPDMSILLKNNSMTFIGN